MRIPPTRRHRCRDREYRTNGSTHLWEKSTPWEPAHPKYSNTTNIHLEAEFAAEGYLPVTKCPSDSCCVPHTIAQHNFDDKRNIHPPILSVLHHASGETRVITISRHRRCKVCRTLRNSPDRQGSTGRRHTPHPPHVLALATVSRGGRNSTQPSTVRSMVRLS